MQTKLLVESGGLRTFALVLGSGDEVMGCLERFAEAERLSAAQFSGIGAFSGATLAYFDWTQKDYLRIPVGEQVEVASLNGDIALAPDGSRSIHIHAVLGRRDGTALAGHLLDAHARPTLELILTETPAHLRKQHDPETGLALIRPAEAYRRRPLAACSRMSPSNAWSGLGPRDGILPSGRGTSLQPAPPPERSNVSVRCSGRRTGSGRAGRGRAHAKSDRKEALGDCGGLHSRPEQRSRA